MSATTNSESTILCCPVCRAQAENGPHCRRCRADLSLLFALEGQRAEALSAARQAAAEGRWQQALDLAGRAQRLRQGEDVTYLLASARLSQHDFAGAWHLYLQARGLSAVAQTPEPRQND